MLHRSKDHVVGGTVSVSGVSPDDDHVVWSNIVSYIDQIDRLHPFLTVFETCEFAWRCRSNGTHRKATVGTGPAIDEQVLKLDADLWLVNKVLEGLGLLRVKDTFVGDQETVRGVSGGEKKRVTVAEMLCVGSPIACCDEISTGLDGKDPQQRFAIETTACFLTTVACASCYAFVISAATTFEIVKLMGAISRVMRSVHLVSLLQPPPETVALFDEVVLLSEGKVIYSGPIDEVILHFNALGYELPIRMDVADWLQVCSDFVHVL
jgi:ABC-type multidrug transport system ATPase subunit